jgi:ribosomal 50S subunit-recycling heat shock protein
VLTIALDQGVRILRVLRFVERRGGAELARTLYEDLSSTPATRESAGDC